MLARLVLLVILSQVLGAAALAQERAPTAEETFKALLERVERGDRTVDFRDLRLAYTETSGYEPYFRNAEDRKGMSSSLNDKQFSKALEYSERVLAKNYVDL